MDLTSEEFEIISEIIYNRTGLRFDSIKNYFVSKRVKNRIEELKLKNAAEYIRYLKFSDHKNLEFQVFVNELTTNETYFFRDYPQLKSFAEHCLVDLASKKADEGNYEIKIWSAGCSSGEEPYTIAIILSEILGNTNDWKINILATDIDQNVLQKAKNGIYGNYRMNEIPEGYLDKYFQRDGDKNIISHSIKSLVRFEHLNLLDSKNMQKKRNYDFIFCRNVLIYFDDKSRKNVVDNFYQALNLGGYIFLGSSESLGRITSSFTLKRMGNYLIYIKEEQNEKSFNH
jgi:chemotaxis protein methyltransferase CheR